ncbi:cupin domain-containing protein [Paraburkholderia elongata]|uniref:Cupin domain-containing protein n=1 Tax=Paraburkholderia elongata TaxID=2675747 RepID=A0A972NK85_9BURK|nr:cupin domain-containing protein [Paraburkholderia elongata]NPT54412.1 cupin domain-containing protein [Paraburkholderia elongata]
MATRRTKTAKVALDEPVKGQRDVAEIVNGVGQRIALLRNDQGLSLHQLAVKSDVSSAAIHKIERSSMVPTITTLLKLGAALGVSVSSLLQEDEAIPDPVQFTGATERQAVYTPHKGISLEGISGSYRQFRIAAAVARMIPGATSGRNLLQHPGEELVHVISGEVSFRVGDQDFQLKAGDSLHFSGDLPHHWENTTDKPANLIWFVFRNE